MPPADIRQLRDLMRCRFKLTCFKSSEKNRFQHCLTVSNIRLGNVVPDTFGKSAQAILDKILGNPADTSFDLEPLVFKSLKKKLPELRDAIDGCITNESAGKKKSVRISKAGYCIKPLLVQCANAVVTSKKHPEIRNRCLRLKKRRGHRKAIIAIARMLLTALYHMLKNGENYNAELYKKSELPPAGREITVEQAATQRWLICCAIKILDTLYFSFSIFHLEKNGIKLLKQQTIHLMQILLK